MTSNRLSRILEELRQGLARLALRSQGPFGFSISPNLHLTVFSDHVGAKLATTPAYENQVSAAITMYRPYAEVFFDIGANIGYHAVTQARRFRAVFAFEPSTKTFGLLTKNIADNHLGNIVALNCGLSDVKGTLNFHENHRSTGCSHFVDIAGEHTTSQVKVNSLDELVGERPEMRTRAVVKIDVEGWEGRVIRGMRSYIQDYKPIVLFEWDGRAKGAGDLKEIKQVFGRAYRFFSLDVPRPRWASSKLLYILYRVLYGYDRVSEVREAEPKYYLCILALPEDLPNLVGQHATRSKNQDARGGS